MNTSCESMKCTKPIAEIEPEDIPLFEEDYARLNIPIHTKRMNEGIEM